MINRRRFLAAGSLVAAAWPSWLRRAFADASVGGAVAQVPRSKEFAEGLARARRLGKQLLVLIVPSDDGAKGERGRAFGEWINHGTAADVAPLAEPVVVCAGTADMGRYAPPGEPLMALVDPRVERPARALDGELPLLDGDPQDPAVEEAVVQRRIALLAGLARSALRHPQAVAARAHQLYPQVVATLKTRPPPGSHWATTSGCCDQQVEPTPEEKEAERRAEEEALKHGIVRLKGFHSCGCGMGHVPEKSRRFLYFFARPDDG